MKPTLRIIHLFCRLLQRERLNRDKVIEECKINSRTFERDISDIRYVLSELHAWDELIYDRNDKCYYLSRGGLHEFTGMDVMALLKVLLGSRALCHDEMMSMVCAIRSLLPYDECYDACANILGGSDRASTRRGGRWEDVDFVNV